MNTELSKREQPFMLGVAARLPEVTERDLELMGDAGIGWLRFGDFKFDPDAFMQGRAQGEEFREAKERARKLRAAGFQIMGLTPGPRELGEALGIQGTAEYFENYRRVNAFYAEQFRGLVEWWQMANELDIWIFRDKMTMEQSVEFLKAGIRGMKEADPQLKVGINITLFPSLPGEVDGNTEKHEGLILAEGLYGDPELPIDYAGFDSYPGTWRKGGPESWHEYLDGFHKLTGKPIIIQEFGYSGAGDLMAAEEVNKGAYPCEVKKWKFSWHGAHTPEIQSEFIRESFRIFAEKPFVLGATYYNWRDARQCWQCKQPDCPAETAWGLLDQDGNPKVSYYGFRAAAEEIFDKGSLCQT
jgi:hypothetical protein